MIYWVKFEGKLFFDTKCTGPLLQTLPLKSEINTMHAPRYRGKINAGSGRGCPDLDSRVKFPYIHKSRSPFWSHFTNNVIKQRTDQTINDSQLSGCWTTMPP